MRIAVGALLFEGNAISPSRCGFEAFSGNYLYFGNEVLNKLRGGGVEVSGAIETFNQADASIVPLLATHGGSGGAVSRDIWESLRDELVRRLDGHELDGVYLALHGAMICEGADHPEIEILQRVRAKVGNIPVVISCDLHADITPELVKLCDAIVGYQHYPHDDAFETGARAAGLLLKILEPGSSVRMHMSKLAMLVSPTTASTKSRTAMQGIYKACRAIESLPGVLAVSVFPLTPWVDRPQGGTAFVIVEDGESDVGRHLTALERMAWAARKSFHPKLWSVEQAVTETRDMPAKPIILSEVADAVGAGAPGDSVYVLRELLTAELNDSFLVQVFDARAATAAQTAGIGSVLRLEIGQSVDNQYLRPVELEVEVVSLHEGRFKYSGGIMGGIESTVGTAAVLRSGNATILVTSRPAYEYGDEQYTAMGLDPRQFKYVVVKNPMNYRQAFSWAPALYAVDSPASARADLTKVQWSHCERPFFPMDDQDAPIYRVG